MKASESSALYPQFERPEEGFSAYFRFSGSPQKSSDTVCKRRHPESPDLFLAFRPLAVYKTVLAALPPDLLTGRPRCPALRG